MARKTVKKTARKAKPVAVNFNAVAANIKAVADPTRLSVLAVLHEGARNVTEIVGSLDMTQPAVSHHLSLMRLGGVIQDERSGRNKVYTLTDKGKELYKRVSKLV